MYGDRAESGCSSRILTGGHGGWFDQAKERYNMRLNPEKCVFGVTSGKFLGFMVHQHGIEANLDKIKAIQELRSPRTIKEIQGLTGRVITLSRFVS
ncbi:hypothetical protein ACOSQ2_012432 [Xanthoceras sorbifolium]